MFTVPVLEAAVDPLETTVTWAAPGAVRSPAYISATSCVALTTSVWRGEPFH